jgi:F-type H+-transporting ATPase subunit b
LKRQRKGPGANLMSIDWVTTAAQLINFLILIGLLKRFLYRPILDGIDAREAEIASRMGEAAAIRESAEAKEVEYKAQIADLSASRAEMLEKTHLAAETERDALLSDARSRLVKEQSEREEHRAEEARQYVADLHQNGARAVLALTRKALSDLADETLEQRIVVNAAAQIKDMAVDLRDVAGDFHEGVVLTRDPLPADAQTRLRDELASVLPGFTFQFDTDPALSPGLNLRLGGAQVGWTVDSYLNGLGEMLEDQAGGPIRKGVTDAV